MVEARIVGAAQLARLSGALNQADPQIRRAFTRTLRRTARRGVDRVKAAADRDFPHEGGMNQWLKDAKFGVRISTYGKNAGLRIVASKSGHDIYGLDRGLLRHPLFNNQRYWYEQDVPPGFFSETLANEQGEITEDLIHDLASYVSMLAAVGH